MVISFVVDVISQSDDVTIYPIAIRQNAMRDKGDGRLLIPENK